MRGSPSLGPGLHSGDRAAVDAESYDRYIGRWSRLFLPTLLEEAQVRPGDTVLDVATGTGEAAKAALGRLGPDGAVIGTDISTAMLATARTRLRDPRFTMLAADGQALPLADSSVDAVVCQLGLMFFADPARGLAEAARVLRPGRRLAICVISTAQRSPVWGYLAEALLAHLPDRRADLYRSFALADGQYLHQLIERAGLTDVRLVCDDRTRYLRSFDDYWAPIESGIGILPQLYGALPPTARRDVRTRVRRRLANHKVGTGYQLGVEMLIASGSGPSGRTESPPGPPRRHATQPSLPGPPNRETRS